MKLSSTKITCDAAINWYWSLVKHSKYFKNAINFPISLLQTGELHENLLVNGKTMDTIITEIKTDPSE